jgi:sec1 family domain-containing protein 1
MVARKLNRMIAEHPTLLRNKSGHSRPLLVILDRNADLITPFQHASTYQALIDDVLTHKANRVEFVVTQDADSKRPKKIPKKFDLDPDEDSFYNAHKFQPFPEAIESNGAELEAVTAREQAIRSKAITGNSSVPDNAANDLATAVDSLPALLDQKKQLEMHTSILQAVMTEVAARDVPQFYELESSLATGSYKNNHDQAKKDVLALVGDSAKGNVDDKIRLIMVYCLATAAKSADIDEVTQAMQKAVESSVGVDRAARERVAIGIKATQYLKQLRSMHMIPTMAEMSMTDEATSSSAGAGLSTFLGRATGQAAGLLAKATDRVASMLGKIHKHYATRVVENLCEMKPGTEDEQFLYLDPKVKGEVDVIKLRNMQRAPVREVIAFTIGGGCYAEYQNLQMVATERRTISYGSTELVDASGFLEQLGQLG